MPESSSTDDSHLHAGMSDLAANLTLGNLVWLLPLVLTQRDPCQIWEYQEMPSRVNSTSCSASAELDRNEAEQTLLSRFTDVESPALRAILRNNDRLTDVPIGGLHLLRAAELARVDIAAIRHIKNLRVRFVAVAAMRCNAAAQANYRASLHEQDPDIAREVERAEAEFLFVQACICGGDPSLRPTLPTCGKRAFLLRKPVSDPLPADDEDRRQPAQSATPLDPRSGPVGIG
jgi:hypothetical protein